MIHSNSRFGGMRYGVYLLWMTTCLWHLPGNHFFAQQYTRTELSVFNGLGQGDIYHISQDSLGYIWITQQHGVAKFNGRDFVQIEVNPADSNALPTSEVYHISHLPNGDAWFSHYKGLSFYTRQENKFKTYTRRDGLHCDLVNSTFVEGDSILYATHWYGYDRIELDSFTTTWLRPFPNLVDSLLRHRSYNLPNHPKQNPFDSNQLFSIHLNNLYVLNKKTQLFSKLTHFEPGVTRALKSAYYLLEYAWIDSNNMLLNFFPNDGEVYTYNLREQKLSVVQLMPGKSLWLSKIIPVHRDVFLCLEQSLGPLRLNIAKGKIELIDTSLTGKTFSAFYCDHQDVLWAGEHGYTYRYEPTQVITYSGEGKDIYFTHDADYASGLIALFGYTETRFLQFENNSFKEISFPELNGKSSNTYYHPFAQKFINLTEHTLTLFRLRPREIENKSIRGERPTGFITDIAVSRDGLYAAFDHVVYYINLEGNSTSVFDAHQSINNLVYYADKLYYSTPGHIFQYDLATHTQNEIFHLDEFSQMLIHVHQHRLFILWREKVKYVELDSDLIHVKDTGIDTLFPDLNFLQINSSGDDLLISAEFMLILINAKTLTIQKTYSYLDQVYIGYWDDVFSPMKEGYYLTTDEKKVVAIPHQLKRPYFLSYQVTEIAINGQYVRKAGFPMQLDYEENNIVIKSDAVYTGIFDKLNYYYRNHHYSDQWLPMKSDILQLLNQKPGHYEIDFKVVDRFGQEQIIHDAVVFNISPPWYLKKLFLGACLMTFIALVYGIYQYRLKALRKNFSLQSRLQQLEMTALKAQMNPHFIFNCLNSIKGLILIGQTEKAVEYIGTFSKLVRSSLDSAEEKLIPLAEELDIAENYLSLEQLRYGTKLKWSIRCHDESLLTTIKMPPFILQPLIENAIVHGIKYVQHDGFIHLLVHKEKSKACIKIIDNGIGLKVSRARIVSQEHTTRKHLGISLVERRLKAIHASLRLHDHTDGSGKVTGTISEICIPLPYE